MPYSNSGSLTNRLTIYPNVLNGSSLLILSKIFALPVDPNEQYSLPITINDFDYKEHWEDAFSDIERNFDYFNRTLAYGTRKTTNRYIIEYFSPGATLPYTQTIPATKDFISNLTYEWLHVMNPLLERIHIPLTRERIYKGKIPTTISISLNGTSPVNNVTISHKFLESDTKITVTNSLPRSLASTLEYDSIENLDTSSFYDTSKVVAKIEDNSLIYNPISENANTQDDYFAIEIRIVRASEGFKRYRDTGNLMRIPFGLKSDTDLFSNFYHQEEKVKKIACDFSGLTISQKNIMPYKLLQLYSYQAVVDNDYSSGLYNEYYLFYNGEKKTINGLIRRGGTVVSVTKTASNKIKIKVKHVVDNIQYYVCFAGLSGNKHKLGGNIINDANGNELLTKLVS